MVIMKRTRNANGQGSTYYNEEKQCYIAQVSVRYTDSEGKEKSRRISSSSKKSRKEALKKVKEKAGEFTREKAVEAGSKKKTADTMTVSVLTSEYIQNKKNSGLMASTIKNYEDYYRGYIKESPIAETSIAEISREELQAFYAGLFEHGNKRKKEAGQTCGLTASTVNHVLVLLKGSFSYACEKKYIQENPHKGITKYKDGCKICGSYTAGKNREKAFRKDDINRLVKTSGNEKDMFYNMFCFILCTGLRSGEARALRWKDIDMVNKTVSVNKTLVHIGKEYLEQPPKSEAGYREIPLNEMALEALERQKKWQDGCKQALRGFYNGNGIVFSDEKGYYVQGQRVLAHFRRLLEKSGIETKYTLHDLRHTFCTLLRDSGVKVENAMKLMGHSDLKTTLLIYTHPCDEERIKATDAIGEAIARM